MVQLDLFATRAIAFDRTFAGMRRHDLGLGAWVDHHPAWISGHEALFDQLRAALPWTAETMRIYDRDVAVPRLLARVPAEGLIEELRRALSERYGEEFTRTTAALYRDGKDSVAWHGDTTARDMDTAIVATVSLGQPRGFLLKPTEGGSSVAFPAGRGDLIVMGGTCQRTWRHSVPKAASR
jgi:alkylated DNA repair dioxygenase AlkB